MNKGTFTISLDFELFWGVRDKRSLSSYSKNLEGVWIAIPKILNLFQKYEIHASWATVGFLFYNSIDDLGLDIPKNLPEYENKNLSPYLYIQDNKINDNDKYHFAVKLIEYIKSTEGQEISSHTFSHFYTMEKNSIKNSFEDDIKSFKKLCNTKNIEVRSIVFPRNQMNAEILNIIKKYDINIYRGNPDHWAYKSGDINKDFKTKIFRFIDTFFNLSGHKTSVPENIDGIYNVKSSMFLRPYSNRFKILESLKLKRIKKAMLYAAKNNENFHLWWHPHNFGINIEENMKNLEDLLKYYTYLNKKYKMKSKNMKELIYE